MAVTRTQFTSQLDHINAALTRDDIYPLRFFSPGDHDPFAVYDPTEAGGTNVVLGRFVQIYSLSSTAETPYDDIKELIDDGYIPYVRYSGYDYVPLCMTGSRLVFMSMFAYDVIGFLQVLSDNTFTQTTRPFIWKVYANVDTASAETLWTKLNENKLTILYDNDNNSYMSYQNIGSTYIAYPVCSDCKYSKITVTRSGPLGAYTYTKTTETPDTIWVHWQNDNGWTTIPDSSTEVTLDQTSTVKAEGSLSASAKPHLAPGLYRFSLEIANHRDANQANPQIFPFDVKVKYGASELRAMGFLTDASLGSSTLRNTWWCGGIFRMPADGDVDITVQCFGLSSGKSSEFKMSHLFVNRIGG
jgi:hypothetical protein